MGAMKNTKSELETGWHITRALAMPECRALAGVIRRRRERLGWTLTDLAGKSGVSRQMLGAVEDDEKVPTGNVTARIAAAFGIPLHQLDLEAYRWLEGLPACCRKCHYSCVHRGEAKWLNAHRKCVHPEIHLPQTQAVLPESP